MADFEKAPEVREIAEKLIDLHHEHLKDSKDLIGYYFREGGGVDWSGKCKKCTAFERHVTGGKMFFIFITKDAWRNMSPSQREALIDHELCHIGRKSDYTLTALDQKPKIVWLNRADPENWYIKDHDVEEFGDIIARHGLWEKGIEMFAETVRNVEYQMTFADLARDRHLQAVK